MSNTGNVLTRDCSVSQGCDAIQLLIQPRDTDLGGFSVRRLLPNSERRMVGPWIFFDHMGPADFDPGTGIDVRPHPHIGLATVTYLFEGEMLHRDSLGTEQVVRPGDINLMVAGKGIVHSEREREEIRQSCHRQHGLQLWLALPAADELIEPAFYHYAEADIPRVDVNGVPARVLIGSAYGVSSPVETFADTLYVEASLEAGQSIALPQAEERAVYVVDGEISAGGTTIPEHAMAVFDDTAGITLKANTPARIAVIGGEHLGPRHVAWNFVASDPARIEQAKADWRAGAFPKVPGDEDEYIPLPG